MTQIHTEPAGRELIDLVDKLRNIPGIQKTIAIPQVVVAGQQSSGKSSVLHAISGIRFPVTSGLCTQFPTEIILRREKFPTTKAFIRSSENITDKRKLEFETFGKKWASASLNDLPQVIDEARALLLTGKKELISSDVLVLEVKGPEQEHLTLIDLPGLIASVRQGQSEADKPNIDRITKSYIDQDRTIVLVVIPAKDDVVNHRIIGLMKGKEEQIPPSLKSRILGIITNPDAKISYEQARNSRNLLSDNEWKFRHGWHVLRNLSDDEIKGGLDRDEVERQFFEQSDIWKKVGSLNMGSGALKQKLSEILQTSISESLPIIQHEVEDRLREVERRSAKLGPPRDDPRKILSFLCQNAYNLEKVITSVLHDSPLHSGFEQSARTISLRAFIQARYDDFAYEMRTSGKGWQFDQGGEKDPATLMKIFHNEGQGTRLVEGRAMLQLIVAETQKYRQKRLPYTVENKWVPLIFRRQARRWLEIAKRYATIIYNEVSRRIVMSVKSLNAEDLAAKLLTKIIEPELRRRKNALDLKLEELFKPYNETEVICLSGRYKELRSAYMSKIVLTVPSEDNQIMNLWASSEAFYDISQEVFVENVANLAVENCLLHKLEEIMPQKAFHNMSDERLQQIGGESAQLRQKRKLLTEEKDMYEQARNEISSRLESLPYSFIEASDDATPRNSPGTPDVSTNIENVSASAHSRTSTTHSATPKYTMSVNESSSSATPASGSIPRSLSPSVSSFSSPGTSVPLGSTGSQAGSRTPNSLFKQSSFSKENDASATATTASPLFNFAVPPTTTTTAAPTNLFGSTSPFGSPPQSTTGAAKSPIPPVVPIFSKSGPFSFSKSPSKSPQRTASGDDEL